jgi:hypothetical protein
MTNAATTVVQSHSGASRAPEPIGAPAHSPRPSDDEILGLVTHVRPAGTQTSSPDDFDLDAVRPEQGTDTGTSVPQEDPTEFRAIFESNPKLRDAWREAQSFRDIFPDVQSAREIQKLFPTVEDARAANSQVSDLARIDTLFFSNRPESHAELAAAIYRLNPTAFRSLAQMMSAMTTSPGGDGPESLGRSSPASTEAQSGKNGQTSPGPEGAPRQKASADEPGNAAHEHAFFHDTNAAAVEGVLNSIQLQLDRLLPDGTPQKTRQRLTGEIYREIDTSLQSNRAFGQQLRQAFRTGQLTPDNQRAIVGMVVGRAKQALPGIAKRVLGEWTNGVLSHANTRQERQRNAAKRIDIAGGAPGGDSPRALMPKDIDYRRMSDNDILNM